MDRGPETIEDAEELATVRAQARKIHLEAFAVTLAVTLATLLLP